MSPAANLLITFLLIGLFSRAQDKYNLSFEQLNDQHQPVAWHIPGNPDYRIQLDSSVSQQGKYSMEIEKISKKPSFGAFAQSLPAVKGKGTIRLVAYLKTQDVSNGYSGLWMRLDDNSGNATGFDNMHDRGVTGTTDWKEYSIELPYKEGRTAKIVIGGILTGDGKVWIDNLHVFLDHTPLDQLPTISFSKKDSAAIKVRFTQASDALDSDYSPAKNAQLVDLCQIWGFLKYYHPAVANGNYDWDSTLVSLIPKVIKADPITAHAIEEQLIDSLGPIPPCRSCKDPEPDVKLPADYGSLFADNHLPASLREKLAFIRDNHQPGATENYVQLTKNGGTEILNETNYGENPFPSAAIRLITLFRYWNIIHYYYPYRNLIKEDWNNVLPELIPRFLQAADKREYIEACFELIGHVHDSHANVAGKEVDSLKGMYILPIQAKFIEGQLVVTNYYSDSADIRTQVQIGDIIQKIDGIPVESLVRKYLPLTPASNEATQFRTLAGSNGWLLRSNTIPAALTLIRSGKPLDLTVQRIHISISNEILDGSEISQHPAWQLLPQNIGYINPAKLKDTDTDSVRLALENTRAIIVDLRCYPVAFMPFSYGAWFKHTPTPFARFSVNSNRTPGAFINMGPLSNGGTVYAKAVPTYKGKLVIIVNSSTKSAAEFTTMALQSVPGAIVVGSITAGADGNITLLQLPGGITTVYSGFGVYYPDAGETQCTGIRINVPAHATIKGISEGRDEYLETAISLIK